MRLHPQVTEDEVYAWLKTEAAPQATTLEPDVVEAALKSMAEAMAAISGMVLPDDVEPLFP
jgi:hypothetical protein